MTTPMPPDARPASQEKEPKPFKISNSDEDRFAVYWATDIDPYIAALKAQLSALEAERDEAVEARNSWHRQFLGMSETYLSTHDQLEAAEAELDTLLAHQGAQP